MINIFDISTLVTDRTQADVQAWNEKGTYNPSDLNRVTHAMEYLVERIRSYGYAVKYEKVKVPHQPQKGKNRLPAGYTELEYIESTGTQRINTGVKPDQDTRVIVDFEIDTSVTSELHICSVRSSSGGAPFYTLYYSGSAWGTRYGTQALKTSTSITTKERHLFDKNKNVTTIDNIETIAATYESFSSDTELPLFCRADGTTYNAYIKGKLYACKIYDNDTLIRDFVPCTNASGTVGLYDMVNGIFYGNAGTGVFTAGAEVELPPVEILDDYTWYYSDIPQVNELNAYLQNVRWLRESMALLPNTPEVPCDMEGFTFAEANDIEMILVNIETIINLMLSSIIYSGEIFSGEVI